MFESRHYARTIHKHEIPSVHLNETRHIKVYIPPGYQDLLSYPTLYCQDGEDFLHFGRIATHTTRLILDEGMEPILIVAVDIDKKLRTEQYSPDGSRFASYCRFFTEELLPFVEQHYSVRKAPAERVLAGDSLGGTVSLHLALDNPQLFGGVLSLSGAFFPSTQQRISEAHDLSQLHLYMVIGLQEEIVKTDRGTFNFLQLNRDTQTLLTAKNAQLEYHEKPGRHIWGFWQNELPEALLHFWG